MIKFWSLLWLIFLTLKSGSPSLRITVIWAMQIKTSKGIQKGKLWVSASQVFANGWTCCIFSCYQILMGRPMHSPYDKAYHRVGIWWNKSTHTLEKLWVPLSQALPIRWVLCLFQCYGILMGKPMHFSCDEANYRIGIWWKRWFFWEKYGYEFPKFSPMGEFSAFSHAIWYWWQDPCISHLMKYIG